MKRSGLKMMLVFGVLLCASSEAAGRFNNIHEILRAADNTQDEIGKLRIYSELRNFPLQNPEDTEAIYFALKSLEGRYRKHDQSQLLKSEMIVLNKALARSTNTSSQGKVAELLETEYKALPSGDWGPASSRTPEEADKATLRMARLVALTEAAGDGKNELALPTLRKLLAKGGIASDLATRAIGKIGKAEDLDRMIEKIKSDHHARVDLTPFGGIIVDRIMKEVDNPNITEIQRNDLIARLGQAKGPANIDKYLPLLHHKNHRVVEVAAEAISESIGKGNTAVASQMISDNDRQVRFNGLAALEHVDLTPDLSLTVMKLLAQDNDEGIREEAAHVLGVHKIANAQEYLRAALNDKSKRVRGAAQAALDRISGKEQADVNREVQEILKRNQK